MNNKGMVIGPFLNDWVVNHRSKFVKISTKLGATLVDAMCVASVRALPIFTTLDIPDKNFDVRNLTNGIEYAPLYPSTTTLAGVPFQFSEDVNGNTAAMTTSSIPVGLLVVDKVYTLINLFFGVSGAFNGTVEFTGSGGAFYSVDLVQGVNIRDHFVGFFNNVITDPTVVVDAFDPGADGLGAHFDRQVFDLPSAFDTQILTGISLNGVNGFGFGIPFIAGATVRAHD